MILTIFSSRLRLNVYVWTNTNTYTYESCAKHFSILIINVISLVPYYSPRPTPNKVSASSVCTLQGTAINWRRKSVFCDLDEVIPLYVSITSTAFNSLHLDTVLFFVCIYTQKKTLFTLKLHHLRYDRSIKNIIVITEKHNNPY